MKAFDAIHELGARVIFATIIVDRGTLTGEALLNRGLSYEALVTYQDLGIPPIAGG